MSVTRPGGILTAACVGLGLWTLFNPRPYVPLNLAVIAMPLAAIALALAGRGRFDLLGKLSSPRSGLGTAILLPAPVLALRVVSDSLQVDPTRFFLPAIILGVTLILLARAADAKMRSHPGYCLFPLAFLTVYAYCALAQVNWMLDSSASAVHRTKVVAKRSDSYKVIRHYLTLDPWPGMPAAREVPTTRELHDSASVNGTVCVTQRNGLFGSAWFRVDACPT